MPLHADGLDPVAWNDQLGGLAQDWSNYMAGSGNYSHGAASTAWARTSSTVAAGSPAGQMHQAWMSSPLHRDNILGNFSVVGIGVACNGGDLYATEDFGR